jgi:hypothetical protein
MAFVFDPKDNNPDPDLISKNPDPQPCMLLVVQFQNVNFVCIYLCMRCGTTEYTELKPLLFGVHSVMRVKLVLAGEGGGCMPNPFYYIYHHQ